MKTLQIYNIPLSYSRRGKCFIHTLQKKKSKTHFMLNNFPPLKMVPLLEKYGRTRQSTYDDKM